MSLASRNRESEARILHGRRGFPTFAAFREAQRAALATWLAEQSRQEAMGDISDYVPMTFPEPSDTPEIKKPILDDNNAACLEIRAANVGCIFPRCRCREGCAIAKGESPDNGNPFNR